MKSNLKPKQLKYYIKSNGHMAYYGWDFIPRVYIAENEADALEQFVNEVQGDKVRQYGAYINTTELKNIYFIAFWVDGELDGNCTVYCYPTF
jgi:hypothetical protein